MRALTPDLLETLSSHYQAAAHGYRCRMELDYVIAAVGGGVGALVQSKLGPADGTTFDSPTSLGNIILAVPFGGNAADVWEVDPRQTSICAVDTNAVQIARNIHALDDGGYDTTAMQGLPVDGYGGPYMTSFDCTFVSKSALLLLELSGVGLDGYQTLTKVDQPQNFLVPHDLGTFATVADGDIIVASYIWNKSGGVPDPIVDGSVSDFIQLVDENHQGNFWWWVGYKVIGPGIDGATVLGTSAGGRPWGGCAVRLLAGHATSGTFHLRPTSVQTDRSRRLGAAQLDATIENEAGGIGVALDSLLQTDAPCRLFQWYGNQANEVLTFAGLTDVDVDARDVRTATIRARDYMKWLIVQGFVASAPQGAGEAGAVRTPANGVYLEYEASAIVEDILDKAGVPTAQRAVTPTSYVLDEYILSDGGSWADQIIGDDRITGLTGYEMGATGAGVIYFRPMLASASPDSDTDPTPDYSYVIGETPGEDLVSPNVLRLDRTLDDYDLKTRIKVRASLATAKPAWTELWHSNTFTKPVGIWWDSAQADHIKVLDRGTKKIYNFKITSPRARDGTGIYPLYVGGNVDYPRGLSGDPADATIFWVLDAGGILGHTTGNKVHKYRKSDGAHLSSFSLPDGVWSDLKVTSSYIWLTSLSTDKTHRYSKTGTAGPSYTTTVSGHAQSNPTGLFADGTTLGIFFLAHARFILVDETDPTTIDSTNALGVTSGIVSTAGTSILGGEIKTTTHDRLWACSDDLGLIWEFQLTEPVTSAVATELIDTDLEDALGLLSGTMDRVHDAHPLVAAHPFEVRRATLTMAKTITNVAQAQETAARTLAELAHRRDVLDLGIVGHPGHETGDLIHVTDPVTGIDSLWVLDTYRDSMDERGFLGTVALVPYDPEF